MKTNNTYHLIIAYKECLYLYDPTTGKEYELQDWDSGYNYEELYFDDVIYDSLEDFLSSFSVLSDWLHLPMLYDRLPTVEEIYHYLWEHYPEIFL